MLLPIAHNTVKALNWGRTGLSTMLYLLIIYKYNECPCTGLLNWLLG